MNNPHKNSSGKAGMREITRDEPPVKPACERSPEMSPRKRRLTALYVSSPLLHLANEGVMPPGG